MPANKITVCCCQVSDIRAFEVGLYKYLDSAQTSLIEELTKEKKLDNLRDKLHAALKEYAANFKADLAAKEPAAAPATSAADAKKAAPAADAKETASAASAKK